MMTERRPRKQHLWLAGMLCAACFLAASAGAQTAEPALLSRLSLENWQSDSGLPQNTVNAILQTRDGYMWIGTDGGLARFDGVAFAVFDLGNTPQLGSNVVRALREAPDGGLRITTALGAVEYRAGVFRAVSGAAKDATMDASASGESAQQVLVAGMQERVTAVLKDRSGDVWLGTASGIVRRNTGGAEESLANPLLADAQVIYEDRDGDVWIGTESSGLSVLRDLAVAQLSALPELGPVRSVAAGPNGSLWIGQNGGLAVLTSAGQVQMAVPELRAQVLSVAFSGGTMWFGTASGLIARKGPQTRTYTTADGLPDDAVRSLYTDADGSVWVGTRHGLAHFASGKFTSYSRMDGLAGDLIGSMVRDGEGTLWVGTLGGLSRLDGDHFVAAQGLPAGAITALAGANGALWVGVEGAGLAQVRGGSVRVVRGGFPDSVYGILPDGSGTLWLNTRHGVWRFNPAGGAVRQFSTAEASTGGHPAAVRMADGTLWFATLRGITRVNPELPQSGMAPLTAIESVEVDDAPVAFAQGVTVPPGRHRVAIHYAGLDFRSPELVTFRYRLGGLDSSWVNAGARRTAYYTGVPPGKYSFAVMSANADGVWSSPAMVVVTAKPLFVQTVWFIALVLVAFACVLWLLYWWRAKAIEAQHRAVLAERTRIAREVHDTLAQGYVALSMQIELAMRTMRDAQGAAMEQLAGARELIRSGLEQARSSIWSLRAQSEESTLPAEIARTLDGPRRTAAAEIAFDVRGAFRPLPSDVEHEVLRIAQEAVANAVRHSAATRITVELSYGAEELLLLVEDNGCGLAEDVGASVPATSKAVAGRRYGVRGMHERAARIGGRLKMMSTPGAGTRVELRLAIAGAAKSE